jgi:hypothetical protein
MGPGCDTPTDLKPPTNGSSGVRASAEQSEVRHLRDEVAGLRDARASGAVIEQAKGVLMGTLGCSADEAFQLLRTQSQHQNRRVREIAEELVAQATRSGGSGRQRRDVGRRAHGGEGAAEQA